MSPRTPTLLPTDGAMWRKLLAAAHPDRNGDHELFIWAGAVRDVVCSGRQDQGSYQRSYEPPPDNTGPERIPYPAGADFQAGTFEALGRDRDIHLRMVKEAQNVSTRTLEAASQDPSGASLQRALAEKLRVHVRAWV